MMETALRSEIEKVALGYDLKYKITDELMGAYLTPAYLNLRRSHPGLCFVEFVDELVKVRAQERTMRWDERILPLCAWCKKVRRDDGNWMTLEEYVSELTKMRFSHGMCPGCVAKVHQAHSPLPKPS